MESSLSTTASIKKIADLLSRLPADNLDMVEQFVRFLVSQEDDRARTPSLAPMRRSLALQPAASLKVWTELLPGGYEGDALADTEALYDEVER